MMYGIFCKTEYFDTWPKMLKEEFAGFATVEVIAPEKIKTISNDVDSIPSPSGKFAISINPLENIGKDEFCVYVVSDGGYLLIWGERNETDEIDGVFGIQITHWQKSDKQIFNEMYDRATKFLNKLDEEN